MASSVRRARIKNVPLSGMKDCHGKPAGVLIGFEPDDKWFDYLLESDPRFLQQIEKARQSIHTARGLNLDKVKLII